MFKSCPWRYTALPNESRCRLDCLVCLRDSSWWIQGQVSEEKSLKKFFCDRFCGHFENIDLDREEGAGCPTVPSLDHTLSCARPFVRLGECAFTVHVSGEREGEQTRKSDRRDLLKWTSFVFFRCTARRWPVRNELFFINGVVDGTSGEQVLTITFRISPVKYRVYFLVVCLFFPRSRIDSQKIWTRNIKNKRHALKTFRNARNFTVQSSVPSSKSILSPDTET